MDALRCARLPVFRWPNVRIRVGIIGWMSSQLLEHFRKSKEKLIVDDARCDEERERASTDFDMY